MCLCPSVSFPHACKMAAVALGITKPRARKDTFVFFSCIFFFSPRSFPYFHSHLFIEDSYVFSWGSKLF